MEFRPELIHPMIIHFPIALLFTGVGIKVVAFFLRHKPYSRILTITAWIVLALGCLSALAALLAGELAASIVQKNLCMPEMLSFHSTCAYTAAILFTLALLLDWGKAWGKAHGLSSKTYKILVTVNFILFLAATLTLSAVGGLGASLVYDQGAAVEKRCPPT